jgi:hypothetical protein
MIDLTGERYGRLVVVEFDRLQKHKTYWKCVCDCGMTVIATGNNLRSGNTKSCGCLHRETVRETGKSNATHSESHSNRTRLYTIWCGMRQRCNNPNKEAFKHYGGKGVTVCPEWEKYSEFKKWALANGYADNLCIDRIDSNGNYAPDNCRWITASENTARANKNHTSRKVIRGEGLSKVSQPQRIEGEKI